MHQPDQPISTQINQINQINPYQPKRIVINHQVQSSILVDRVLKHCPEIPRVYQEIDKDSPCLLEKDTLILTRHKGNFYKPCPGTLNYLCCLYKILNVGLNCPLSCNYCILQSYLEYPGLVIHANIEDLFLELDQLFRQYPEEIFRIGTGEFTDSLALDHLTELSTILVPYFSQQTKGFLELKTKTDNLANLERLDHQGHTIVAWSLNADTIVRHEEGKSPSLEKRLRAAQKAAAWGYKLAFHFDPIIYFPGWEKEYQQTIDQLFSMINPSCLTWISLGCFRFMPSLKAVIQEKVPQSKIIYEEFIKGLDGKMRYLEPLRAKIYASMVSWIRPRAPHCLIYLCMESPKIWKSSLGYTPADNQELKSWLDQRCLEVNP